MSQTKYFRKEETRSQLWVPDFFILPFGIDAEILTQRETRRKLSSGMMGCVCMCVCAEVTLRLWAAL